MSGKIFVFGEKKSTELENVVFIGKQHEYNSLENYLNISKNYNKFIFTKNYLGNNFFESNDIFISRIHKTPLVLRLQETTIPREATVITSEEKLEKIIENTEDYIQDDYDIFSGGKILSDRKDVKISIIENISILSNVLYQFLGAGYLTLENNKKIDDWIICFQEPILDIFIRYFRFTTSADDTKFSDEFLINPKLRRNTCIVLMKVISNYLIKNKYIGLEDVSKFKSWENIDLWMGLREKIKILNR